MAKSIMLTPKDALYIEDLLNQSLSLNKRLAHEVTLLKDKDLIKEVNNVNKKLASQYSTMVQLIKGGEEYAK